MTPPFTPSVDTAIFALRPDYVAVSVIADGVVNAATYPGLEDDGAASAAPWRDAHLEAWRAAYRAFGAKPQRTPCSAEALLKRREGDGRLPSINAVVDLYNAISVRYAVPVGGENVAAYVGSPRLLRADGTESFDTLREGQPDSELVPAGEVIWRDDVGVTCRRWNWRQGVRTRIDAGSRCMWFVFERLEPMPLSAVIEAAALLATHLRRMSPGARVSTALLDQSGTRAVA